MKTTLALSILLATASLAALAPAAEARQLCTYGTGDPCDDALVCVWNRLGNEWVCFVEIHCDPTYCDPYWP